MTIERMTELLRKAWDGVEDVGLAMANLDDDQSYALEELREAGSRYVLNPNTGTMYALEMAIAECDLLEVPNDLMEAARASALDSVIKRRDDPNTPAKPSERRRGSSRNPEGSASSSSGGIKVSAEVEQSLRNKVTEHNEKHRSKPGKKVTLGQLKAVYRRGAGAFSSTHRPSQNRASWSMARVNAYLTLVRSGRPKNSKYTQDNDLLPKGHPRSTKKAQGDLTTADLREGGGLKNTEQMGGKKILDALRTAIEENKVHLSKAETADERRKKELHGRWRELVNMSVSQLERFLDSDGGRVAGLSREEASRAGIGRGRDSARALIRMIPKGRGFESAMQNWSAEDWRWAGRQVNFISRMRGNSGSLTDEKGKPSRKLLSLLVWGHDPRKSRKAVEPLVMTPAKKRDVRVIKSEELAKLDRDDNGDLRLATGIVLEPNIVDAQGDTYTADEIRRTAHLYMLDYQNISLQHRETINQKARLVESWLVPDEGAEIGGTRLTPGTWVMTVRIFDDELWEKTKKGELSGFSIEGFAKRVPVGDAPRPFNPDALGS